MNAAELFDQITKGEKLPWPELWEHVGDRVRHSFRCDDRCGVLTVLAGPDGDMWAGMDKGDSDCHFGPPGIRARTYIGGGRSERVRRALMLLALAIKADSPTAGGKEGA